jgi:spore maturation protein CgeB
MKDLDRVLNGVVPSFHDETQFRQLCKDLLASPQKRQAHAKAGRSEVIERHTFAHRARQILDWAGSTQGRQQ